jgi:hypothetical protein
MVCDPQVKKQQSSEEEPSDADAADGGGWGSDAKDASDSGDEVSDDSIKNESKRLNPTRAGSTKAVSKRSTTKASCSRCGKSAKDRPAQHDTGRYTYEGPLGEVGMHGVGVCTYGFVVPTLVLPLVSPLWPPWGTPCWCGS